MNRQLLNDLLALKQRDTDTRSRLLQEGKLYGDYAPEMQQVHRENANLLDKLISKYGWPGISLVGLEGSRAAWLIPIVGSVGVGAYAYYDTAQVARTATELFSEQFDLGPGPEHA